MASKTKIAISTEDFEHDAVILRTTDEHGRAYGGFQYPLTVGAIVSAPDWNPNAVCGGGLHGLLDALGNPSLMALADAKALWWVMGIKRDEAVNIEDDKVKVPRCKVLYFGTMGGAMSLVAKPMTSAIQKAARPIIEATSQNAIATTGNRAPAATTGEASPAATTGEASPAATTGYRAPAATTGYRAPAATTGKSSIAASLGYGAKAKAGEGGAIVLARYAPYSYDLVAVFASMVGQNGIKPDTWYELNDNNEPVEVAA